MANSGIDINSPHYKGEFGSIYEVNRKFPTGGVAGDFVVIEGWAHYWNADRATWCVNAERDSYWDELMTNINDNQKEIKAELDKKADSATVDAELVKVRASISAEIQDRKDAIAAEAKARNDAIAAEAQARKESIVQELGEAENKVISQKVVTENFVELQNTVFPLQVSLSLDKTLLEFTDTEQTIKASYSIKRKDAAITPTSLALSINGVMKEIDIKASDTISIDVNKEGESIVDLTAKLDDLVKSATAKVVMVLPIYFGFGTSEVDVAIADNKQGPRTSAAGVFEKTSTKDRVNFIILVPKTMPGLSSFTMGGAPFVMITTSVVINGKDYYMYKSGGVYMSGTTVSVHAS
jgi:hypothetical protein